MVQFAYSLQIVDGFTDSPFISPSAVIFCPWITTSGSSVGCKRCKKHELFCPIFLLCKLVVKKRNWCVF